MLKPFQIRNLHLYPAEENLYDSSTESVVSSSHVDETHCRRSGLIHLTAPEYDNILRDHPNAGLTYIDDDDGDIVTVGSSFELKQRLDEPAEDSRAAGSVLSSQRDDTPMHLFDIRRSRSVIELWKGVENKSTRWNHTSDYMSEPVTTDAHDSTFGKSEVQSTDLHKEWLEICRPPRLLPEESAEKGPQSPVIDSLSSTPVAVKSTSPTIMSLSAITDEGRRQAEEAGARFHGLRNIPITSPTVPDFLRNQHNPWATSSNPVTEPKEDSQDTAQSNQSSSSDTQAQPEIDSQPLLSAFEAEMAKMLEESSKEQSTEHANEPVNPDTSSESHTQQAESSQQTWPVNLVVGILQSVAGGMENLGSELRTKIPEVERHLSNAQRNIPEDVGATMNTALSAIESQIQNLARVVQNASNASGEAAERVRQAELRSTEQVLSGLGNMAHEFEEFGKTLFSAFEAEFGQRNNGNEANVSDSTAASNQDTNVTPPQAMESDNTASTETPGQSVEKETAPAKAESSREPLSKSHEAATLEPPTPFTQRPPPPHPSSSQPTQAASHSVSNNQPQAAGLQEPIKPLFSNWPNRPAFVPSHIATIPPPAALSNTVNRQVQPSNPTSTDPQSISFLERANTLQSNDSVTSLFMGNIGFQVTERVIKEVFALKGFSAQIQLPIDSSTGKHAGFGYARFQSATSAKAALDTLQGIIIDGHSLNLEYSDSSPIDGLETQASASQPAHATSNAYLNRSLHHRHSWQPSTQRIREHRPPVTSSSETLPSVFSGNSRSVLSLPGQRTSLVEGNTSQSHPEESPEFAARYPSLLPSYRSQEYSAAVPERSMTLSPNSEMARFPPVSQLDAHLLANQNRSRDRDENERHLSSYNRTPSQPTVGIQRAATSPSSHQRREPRRMTSTINRRDHNSSHSLRRSATEAMSLRHRAHENASRETRPSSVYEMQTLPGSFPVDDAPVQATNSNNNGSTDRDMEIAMRRSIIDNCVDNLVSFGYGSQVDGGRQRLSIYAEAAEGKLPDAIDMIEEDITAYERYMPNA